MAADPVDYWNTSAAAWVHHADEIDAHARPYGEAGMTALAPAPGERLLDLGCGCGDTTLELGRRVGPEGSVTGMDVAAPMLELARRRASEAGAGNVAFVHADVGTAPLSDLAGGPADGAYSRFGVMFFPDPVPAFANVAAALRPGGRAAFVVWQGPDVNPWWLVPTEAAAEPLGAQWEPPAVGDPGPFGLADPAQVRSILGDAGFVDVGLETFSSSAVVRPDAMDDDAGRLLRIGPMRMPWDDAGEDARRAAVAAVREAVQPFQDGDGFRLPGAVWVITARRPPR